MKKLQDRNNVQKKKLNAFLLPTISKQIDTEVEESKDSPEDDKRKSAFQVTDMTFSAQTANKNKQPSIKTPYFKNDDQIPENHNMNQVLSQFEANKQKVNKISYKQTKFLKLKLIECEYLQEDLFHRQDVLDLAIVPSDVSNSEQEPSSIHPQSGAHQTEGESLELVQQIEQIGESTQPKVKVQKVAILPSEESMSSFQFPQVPYADYLKSEKMKQAQGKFVEIIGAEEYNRQQSSHHLPTGATNSQVSLANGFMFPQMNDLQSPSSKASKNPSIQTAQFAGSNCEVITNNNN